MILAIWGNNTALRQSGGIVAHQDSRICVEQQRSHNNNIGAGGGEELFGRDR